MSIFDVIGQAESSGGQNVWGPTTSSGQAQGTYQITTGTWNDFAPQSGVNLTQYPTPNSAPLDVQQQVASNIPLSRWAGSTQQAVLASYPGVDTSQTVGQINAQVGGATSSGGYTYAPASNGVDSLSGEPLGPGGATTGSGIISGSPQSSITSLITTSFTRIAVVVVGIGVLLVGLVSLKTGQSPVQIVSTASKKVASAPLKAISITK